MKKEQKENLAEWISIFITLISVSIIGVMIVVLLLAWALWLAKIFIYPIF